MLAVVFVFSSPVFASDAPKPVIGGKALEGLHAGPTVTVTASQISHSITAPFGLHVRILNLTENDISLEQVTVYPPVELLATRALTTWKAGTVTVQNALLNAGYERDFFFTFPPDGAPLWVAAWRGQRLTFVPSDYELRVSVGFQIPGSRGASQVDQTTTLQLEPPISSLIAGGIAGALLLAAFMVIVQYKLTLGESILKAIYIGSSGVVCSIIAVVLLERLRGVNLPVQVTVTDFYGAMVIGLFSAKIGEWLVKQLGGASPARQ